MTNRHCKRREGTAQSTWKKSTASTVVCAPDTVLRCAAAVPFGLAPL